MSKHDDIVQSILENLAIQTRKAALAEQQMASLSTQLYAAKLDLTNTNRSIANVQKYVAEITAMGITSERHLEASLNLAIKHMSKKTIAAFREVAGTVDVGMLERFLRQPADTVSGSAQDAAPLDAFREVDQQDGYADAAAEASHRDHFTH